MLISERRARRFSIRATGLPTGLINSPRRVSPRHKKRRGLITTHYNLRKKGISHRRRRRRRRRRRSPMTADTDLT